MLSTNTRRTKVVELSTGTHRVPDELRKHYLSDGEGGQYSTNLDRNRYGNDDQYLFTGEGERHSSKGRVEGSRPSQPPVCIMERRAMWHTGEAPHVLWVLQCHCCPVAPICMCTRSSTRMVCGCSIRVLLLSGAAPGGGPGPALNPAFCCCCCCCVGWFLVCLLFPVIRYDLEYLNVCPCMVDVEIIDAKNDHQSIFVSAGPEACICHKVRGGCSSGGWQGPAGTSSSSSSGRCGGMSSCPCHCLPWCEQTMLRENKGRCWQTSPAACVATSDCASVARRLPKATVCPCLLLTYPLPQDGGYMMRPEYPPRGAPREVVPVAAAPVSAGREHSSPRRSGSGVSQLFDALIMAATGGTEGAAAAAVGGEPPVDSRGVRGGSGGAVAAAAAAAANATAAPASMGPSLGGPPVGGGGSGRQHPAVGRQRSRLLSALSYGDVDSLQNALDAFRVRGPGTARLVCPC